MRVRITRAGADIDVSASELKALQEQFHQRLCILFKGFIAPDLLSLLQERIAAGDFFEKHNRNVGDEVRMRSDSVSAALEFLLNDPRLYRLVRDISGIGPIGCYRGRVYSLLPNTGMMSDWHTDMVSGRMATLVTNLSQGVYEGGLLQFKREHSEEILTEVHNTGFGDATFFKIDHDLKHRVTPISGRVTRTMYAGWFLDDPDYATMLRERLAAPHAGA